MTEPDYAANHRDLIPQIAAGELDAQRNASNRIWEALLLAQTPEGWAALIRGEQIPHDQVDTTLRKRHDRRMGPT